MDQLLTPQEVAERLGTSLRFVRRLILSVASHTPSSAGTCGSPPATWTPSSPPAASRPTQCRTRPTGGVPERCLPSNTAPTDPNRGGRSTGDRMASGIAAASPASPTPSAGSPARTRPSSRNLGRPQPGRRRFNDWADEWWAVWSANPGRSPKTLEAADSHLRLHIRSHFGTASFGRLPSMPSSSGRTSLPPRRATT